MEIKLQVIICLTVWLGISMVHGVVDHIKGEAPFWRRPLVHISMWAYTLGGLVAMVLGLQFSSWFTSHDLEVIAAVPLVLTMFAGMGVVAGIGCTFFIPFVGAKEIN